MDARIDYIFHQEMKDDTSFQEKENPFTLIFGGRNYSKNQVRETWHNGIKKGIEIGLMRASLEGQMVELNKSIDNERHLNFFKEFCTLSEKYECYIQYHPQTGMVIIDRNREEEWH